MRSMVSTPMHSPAALIGTPTRLITTSAMSERPPVRLRNSGSSARLGNDSRHAGLDDAPDDALARPVLAALHLLLRHAERRDQPERAVVGQQADPPALHLQVIGEQAQDLPQRLLEIE